MVRGAEKENASNQHLTKEEMKLIYKLHCNLGHPGIV